MAIELKDIVTSTRGRNPRQITYRGIASSVSRAEGEKSDTVDVRGAVTSWKDFVELVQKELNGDMQSALDMAADGFNLYQREQALETDEFAGLLDGFDWAAIARKAGLEDKTTEGGKSVSAIDTAQGQFKRSVRVMAQQSGEEIAAIVEFLGGKLPKVKVA